MYQHAGNYDGQLVEDVNATLRSEYEGENMDIRDVLTPNESTVTENIAASND